MKEHQEEAKVKKDLKKKTKKTYRCAGLDKKLAHRGSVVHCIKRRHLVDTHGGHIQQTRHLIHDTDAGEAVLALTQIQKGHHSRLLVLLGVSLEDLGHDGLVFLVELEGDIGVVVCGVAMLEW